MNWLGEKTKEVNKTKVYLVVFICVAGKLFAHRHNFSAINFYDFSLYFISVPYATIFLGVISQQIYRKIFKEKKRKHRRHLVAANPRDAEDKADDESLNFALFWCGEGVWFFYFLKKCLKKLLLRFC